MRYIVLVAVMLGVPLNLEAQDQGTGRGQDGLAYAFAALGVCEHGVALVGAGGGGEVFIYRRFSLSGDAGAYTFTDTVPFGVATVNANYHFRNPARRRGSDPFVTGGWAMGFAPGGWYGKIFNVGGGLNYWVRDHFGIRIEARALLSEESAIMSRFGVSFR